MYLSKNLDGADKLHITKQKDDFVIRAIPTEKDKRRIEAADYIEKFGTLSCNKNHIIYPICSYMSFEHSDKLKALGVRFKYVELKHINLEEMLSIFIKESTNETNGFIELSVT